MGQGHRKSDAATGQPVTWAFVHDHIYAAAFSPDSRCVVTVDTDGTVRLDAATGERTPFAVDTAPHRGAPEQSHWWAWGRDVWCPAFSTNNHHLLVVDGLIARVWDADTAARHSALEPSGWTGSEQ